MDSRNQIVVDGTRVEGSDSLSRWLTRFGTFVVPAIVAVLTWWLATVEGGANEPTEIPFVAVVDTEGLAPAHALARMSEAHVVAHFETKRREHPVWLLFDVPGGRSDTQIELPSRHATEVTCYAVSDGVKRIGRGSRAGEAEAIRPIKGGFALDPAVTAMESRLLCMTLHRGPARISVNAWHQDDLRASAERFSRTAGLIDGAGLLVALFMMAVAIFNREALFAMLGGWLLCNLRVGALSAGMDFGWLGAPIPFEWLYGVRQFTFVSYYILTVLAFAGLFRSALATHRRQLALRAMKWSTLPVLVAALALPYGSFLPILWACAIGVIVTQMVLLITMSQGHRSSVTLWFAGALALTLLGSLYEVIAAATGWRGLIDIVNNVSGAFASSVLGAVAVAAHVRQERTQRLEAQHEALRMLNKVQDTFRASPIGLFSVDSNGQIVRYNPALCAMLGYSERHEAPIRWSDHLAEATLDELRLVPKGKSTELELGGRTRTGEPRTFLVHAVSSASLIEASLQDVSERRVAVDRLRFLADHDPLTELLNRRGIETILGAAILASDEGMSGAIAYVDLDRFKLINDLYGHPVGDAVLKQVSQRMLSVTEGCSLARVGGDEFVVVFGGCGIERARDVCLRLVGALSNTPVTVGDRSVRIEGSIGLCELNPEMTIHDAIATADRACREAKRDRRAGVTVYDRSATAFADRAEELSILSRLSGRIDQAGLFLEMQPIMSLSAPFDSLNFEVLLRMRDPGGRVMSTPRLVNAAETSGLMPLIDRWVLQSTLQWLEENRDRLSKTNFACVNLSGVSLNDERFVADVIDMLAEMPNASRRLCLEITETVALHDLCNTRRWIDKLRRHGVKVALDDFGAGYTSFSYLRDLPADSLKIDGSFIRTINQHPANYAIVQVIVELAANLGMRTIAEWVEDRDALETLAGLGAHYAQGWVIAKPQSPSALLAASSAADFISDAATLEAVHDYVDKSRWGRFRERLFPLGQRL